MYGARTPRAFAEYRDRVLQYYPIFTLASLNKMQNINHQAITPGSIVEIEFSDNTFSSGVVKKLVKANMNHDTLGLLNQSALESFGFGDIGIPVEGYVLRSFGSMEEDEQQPEGIVIHSTVTYNLQDALYVLQRRGLSYNIIIDKNGSATCPVLPPDIAAHASGFNTTHIGISFVNLAYSSENEGVFPGRRGAPPESEWIRATFKGRDSLWEPFPEQQIQAGVNTVRALMTEYPTIKSVIPHSDIDSRKVDPGPAFPWRRFSNLTEESSNWVGYPANNVG